MQSDNCRTFAAPFREPDIIVQGEINMRLWLLIFIWAISGATALAQDTNQTYKQQADHVQLQRLQQELEISRMQAQTESMQRNAERMSAEIKLMDAESKQSKHESFFETMARNNAEIEAERKARKTADAIQEDNLIAEVKSADFAYLCIAIALPMFFGFYLANKVKKGVMMKYEEKFGILLMIGATLAGLVAIGISDGWLPSMDALQNIMLALRFRLLAESDSIYSSAAIDLPTKYVLLLLISVGAYGFTTYMGITPPWQKTGSLQDLPIPSEKSES